MSNFDTANHKDYEQRPIIFGDASKDLRPIRLAGMKLGREVISKDPRWETSEVAGWAMKDGKTWTGKVAGQLGPSGKPLELKGFRTRGDAAMAVSSAYWNNHPGRKLQCRFRLSHPLTAHARAVAVVEEESYFDGPQESRLCEDCLYSQRDVHKVLYYLDPETGERDDSKRVPEDGIDRGHVKKVAQEIIADHLAVEDRDPIDTVESIGLDHFNGTPEERKRRNAFSHLVLDLVTEHPSIKPHVEPALEAYHASLEVESHGMPMRSSRKLVAIGGGYVLLDERENAVTVGENTVRGRHPAWSLARALREHPEEIRKAERPSAELIPRSGGNPPELRVWGPCGVKRFEYRGVERLHLDLYQAACFLAMQGVGIKEAFRLILAVTITDDMRYEERADFR